MVVTAAAGASGTVAGNPSGSIVDQDASPIAATLAGSVGALTITGVTVAATSTVAGGEATVTFTIPAGLTYCSDAPGGNRLFSAPDQTVTGLNTVSTTPDAQATSVQGTHIVVVTDDNTVGGSVSISTHLATDAAGVGCSTTAIGLTAANFAVPELRHMSDTTGGAFSGVITRRDIETNVRNSRHTVCTVAQNTGIDFDNDGVLDGASAPFQGDVAPVAVALPGITLANIQVTNGGGYDSTADTDPTFSDVRIFLGDGTATGQTNSTTTAGLLNATCVSWVSLDAGDQSINIVYVGANGLNYSAHWDSDGDANDNDGDANDGTPNTTLVKEWNRLVDSEVTLSGGASGTAAGNSTTTPVITKTLGLVLDPVSGSYVGNNVTITDIFRGHHTNSAGQREPASGEMALAGVNWSWSRASGSSSCGQLTGTASGVTTLNAAGLVTGGPVITFDPDGCAPGQVVTIQITGSEPGPLGSGTGITVTELVRFEFTAQIPAKHVFLAWAGQRVVLEHNWALDAPANNVCPAQRELEVHYVKGSGPGNFVPGGTMYETYPDEAWGYVTGSEEWVDPCISVAVYESEDQGQVDIEAFVNESPASKVAFVVYYMKINTINVSLATQVSKPTHNSSAAPDWAPGNPWDASKDDADNAAEWNVSKDILVRGRVTGWFTNANPSGRPRDDSNPLNVLPADRWVMPQDWPLLAGGPGDGDGSTNAIGTAEQFRPYYDIMIDPDVAKNGGRALQTPLGNGLIQVAAVATGNTGTGSSTSPIAVTTCSSLTAGASIYVGTTAATVSSCSSNLLVLSSALTSAPAAGTGIFKTNGIPFVGPYSALDIVGLSADGFGTNAPYDSSPYVRDTAWKDGDVDMWDAPMPPALVSVAIRGTGFIKQVIKSDVYYLGTPNTTSQIYPNPFYYSEIPESPYIPAVAAGGGYFWNSWGGDGAYQFWKPVRIGVNSAGIGDSLTSTDTSELAIIRTAYGDSTIARDLVVYSDNHGEFMVAANGDFKTDLTACQTNVLAGGKHCKRGDKVGTGTITATVDYPDFRGKHFPVLSNAAKVDWTWGGYKDVTVEKGETDQYKYIVFHAMDRDGFCANPVGAVLLHSVLTTEDDKTDFSSLGARYNGDPDENVDFLIDSGEGIIIGQSGGGVINDGKQFATGVTTYSVALNVPSTTGILEFPLSPLAAEGQTDECQAWIKVSNSLLGVLNVLTIAHDDEGNIGFDRVIDLTNTHSYTLNFRWSLITWVGADAISVNDAIKGTGTSGKNPGGNDISASVTAIYGWDAAAQQWLGFFPSGVNVPGANDLNSLKTGDAYWIAITGPSSVTWTVASNVN
jgi:hypothetical protein